MKHPTHAMCISKYYLSGKKRCGPSIFYFSIKLNSIIKNCTQILDLDDIVYDFHADQKYAFS